MSYILTSVLSKVASVENGNIRVARDARDARGVSSSSSREIRRRDPRDE